MMPDERCNQLIRFWAGKSRSTSPVSPVDLLGDTAHRWRGNTPTSPCAPSAPPKNRL
jgi:hypothetical protein